MQNVFHFKSNEGLGTALRIMTMVTAACLLLTGGLSVLQYQAYNSWRPDDMVLMIVGLGDILYFFVFITMAILTMVWMWRVYTNLDKAGFRGFRHSRGATIWGWMVPIASLFIPYNVMSDLHRGSHSLREVVKTGSLPQKPASNMQVVFWWAFYLLGSVTTSIGNYAWQNSPELGLMASIFGSGFNIFSLILFFLVCRSTSAAEAETLHLIRTGEAVTIPGLPKGPEQKATVGAQPFGKTQFDEPEDSSPDLKQ